MKLWKKNLILIIAVIAILAVPFLILNGAGFAGSDDLAVEQITKINPDYKPWFKSLVVPASNEVESFLFALQAAIGAGIVGFALGRITADKKGSGTQK